MPKDGEASASRKMNSKGTNHVAISPMQGRSLQAASIILNYYPRNQHGFGIQVMPNFIETNIVEHLEFFNNYLFGEYIKTSSMFYIYRFSGQGSTIYLKGGVGRTYLEYRVYYSPQDGHLNDPDWQRYQDHDFSILQIGYQWLLWRGLFLDLAVGQNEIYPYSASFGYAF